MNKIKRTVIAIIAVVCAFSSIAAISANAKTLEESFSGRSEVVTVKFSAITGMTTYAKKSIAETKGYTGRHYVRAYVGGTADSADNTVADSGRVYSLGDVTATAQGGSVTGKSYGIWYALPKAYAKYGI